MVDEAQNNLSKTVFVAPIDGTVIERSREVGERVRGSDFNEDVVLTLAGLASMEVKRSRWGNTRWCTCAMARRPR